MPLLDANRRALAARFPELLAPLAAAADDGSARAADPSWPENISAQPRLCYITSGLPPAAVLAAFFARTGRESLLWAVELSAAPLAALLAREDLSRWLADPRVFVSLGAPGDAHLRRLNRELAWVDNARAVPYPPVHGGDTATWKPLFAATLGRLQQRWKHVFTDLRLAPVRVENTAANLARFLASPGIEALAGAFAGAPLIVVAAGPSLDDAHDFLRAAHPRALIVTGNTSFRALASRGLRPHLTVSIDPFPTTDLGYRGQELDGTHLVAPSFAFPQVSERFAARTFGMPDQSHLIARLRAAAQLPPAPALLGDGTVSATVLNLAAYFGCGDVFFVGQDLALGEDGRTHAVDTFYTEQGWNQNVDAEVHTLPGTTRESVTATSLHRWYLRVVESLVARHTGRNYWNTSHRGARIAGTAFLSYADAAARLAAFPERDFAAELAARHRAAAPAAPSEPMRAELDRARAGVSEGTRLALAAALAGELAAASGSTADVRRFSELANRYDQWRGPRERDLNLLLDGATKEAIFVAEKTKARLPADTPNRPLREALETAWAFAEGGAFMHRCLAAAG